MFELSAMYQDVTNLYSLEFFCIMMASGDVCKNMPEKSAVIQL